ncbi:hypothetical protein DH2020_011286 [Rehmannia glutinosa]|uniref:PB1 domain-containing protein n=1 Tax=Rehmannia glutinosa TaxID=99300 RepID=A0ABR0XCX8_REHGL
MKKLTYLIDGEMILKYQVVSEDLDALVSVKSDEDLRHMFDEIDLYELRGSPRLRAFLFPANHVVIENHTGSIEPHALDQRYIDSINGIIRSAPFSTKQGSRVSSACSSPRSPDSYTAEAMNVEYMLPSNHHQYNGISMHKAQSSPNICSHYVYQLHPQYSYHSYRQVHHPGYLSPKPPIDSFRNVVPERLVSVRSVGRADGLRYNVDHVVPQYYYYGHRQNQGGGGCCTKCMHYDDCGHFSDRRINDRTWAMSSVPSSPRYGQGEVKAWDNTTGGDTRAD